MMNWNWHLSWFIFSLHFSTLFLRLNLPRFPTAHVFFLDSLPYLLFVIEQQRNDIVHSCWIFQLFRYELNYLQLCDWIDISYFLCWTKFDSVFSFTVYFERNGRQLSPKQPEIAFTPNGNNHTSTLSILHYSTSLFSALFFPSELRGSMFRNHKILVNWNSYARYLNKKTWFLLSSQEKGGRELSLWKCSNLLGSQRLVWMKFFLRQDAPISPYHYHNIPHQSPRAPSFPLLSSLILKGGGEGGVWKNLRAGGGGECHHYHYILRQSPHFPYLPLVSPLVFPPLGRMWKKRGDCITCEGRPSGACPI